MIKYYGILNKNRYNSGIWSDGKVKQLILHTLWRY